MIHPAEQYQADILKGRIPAGRYVQMACERQARDLVDGPGRGLHFDREAAQHRIEFYRFCRHSKGEWAGQVIEPEPWQQYIKWCVYGWYRDDGTRRFRTVYEEVARKNGKSTDLSVDGLYLLGFDGEPGAEVFNAATKRQQARIIHGESVRMVKSSPALRKLLQVFKDNIHIRETASKFEPLGRDSNTEDGLNVHGALIDEYHAHPDSGMYDVLRSGMGSRRQPLLYIITTAGFDRACACYELREYAIQVLKGSFEDDALFAIIYTLDLPEKEGDEGGDDWLDESVWIKANPNLGVSVKIEDMRDMAREAEVSPSARTNFLTKKLNVWTNAEVIWIPHEKWASCNFSVDADALRGRPCYGGMDLSTTTDITAWVMCFPPIDHDDRYLFLFKFFLPQADLRDRVKRDRVPYDDWIRRGLVMATPGNVIDYEFIKAEILECAARYDLREIAYDPYNSSQLVTELMDEGIEMVLFRQGFLSMSPASKDFEKRVLAKEIAHGGNPVMAWMVSCASVAQDPSGNIKPVKPDRKKSSKRIDGVVASIMALDRAVKGNDSSPYDERDLLVL